MASELERRLAELEQERGRLRQSIQRIGASFAANLDRATLLELGIQTVVDGTGAGGGRATVLGPDGQLVEAARAGSVWDNVQPLARAENEAVRTHEPARVEVDDRHALAVPLGPATTAARVRRRALARADRRARSATTSSRWSSRWPARRPSRWRTCSSTSRCAARPSPTS